MKIIRLTYRKNAPDFETIWRDGKLVVRRKMTHAARADLNWQNRHKPKSQAGSDKARGYAAIAESNLPKNIVY